MSRLCQPSILAYLAGKTPDESWVKPFVLELTDEGIWSETAVGTATLRYEAVQEIVVTPEYAFILVTAGGGHTHILSRSRLLGYRRPFRGIIDAYILPKDRLDPNAIHAFLAELRWQCVAAIQARKGQTG
ncbi:MAG: YcxB family protein [Pirellulales bacterium]|nr:YcxB family protein [Pirellulales bacterium]